MAKLKLKKFSLSDLNKILEIEKASFPHPYSRSYFEKLYQKYPEGFIVAENEEGIIGYTIGRPENGKGEIISLAVKPGWRRKGVGKALTNLLIDHFKEKGFLGILLHVQTENKSAIAFYQNLDFKILKTIKNYYPNGDDAFLMKKEI